MIDTGRSVANSVALLRNYQTLEAASAEGNYNHVHIYNQPG